MYNPQLKVASEPLKTHVNVGDTERLLSVAGGAALTAYAIVRRNGSSIPALLAGIALLARGTSGRCLTYDALDISTAGSASTTRAPVSVPHEHGFHVTRAVTIDRPAADLYNFWHEPTNLPHVINYIDSVHVIGENQAHWTIKLPGGAKADFDVEVYTDVPNEVISWRSLPGSSIQNAGSVRFQPAPADRGTQVTLTLEFVPPGGALGQAVLKLFGEAPAQYIGQYLREFKQVMETGEKPTNDGQSSGRKSEAHS